MTEELGRRHTDAIMLYVCTIVIVTYSFSPLFFYNFSFKLNHLSVGAYIYYMSAR